MAAAFAGRRAVVTGAGAGFGEAFARALAQDGAQVALLDIDGDSARRVAADIGPSARAFDCDVADADAMVRVADAVADAFGGIDLLINNAGLHSEAFNKGFAELGAAKSKRLFDVNVMGVVHGALACRDYLAASGSGVILNIASIAAWACSSAYGVSKLAVRGLTLELAQEFKRDRIRVNAIAPGLIATPQIRADFPQEFFDRFANDLQMIDRTGEVADVVAAMRFLCSDAAAFVTGETLRVSGGYPATV